MLLDNYYSRIPEACLPSSDWFEYQQSINLLIISIAVVDVDASLGWLSASAFKNVIGISYWDNFSYSYISFGSIILVIISF